MVSGDSANARVRPRSQIVSAADPGPWDEIGAGLLMA